MKKVEKIYKNGTPFPPRVWKQWFAHKSSRDIALEEYERKK